MKVRGRVLLSTDLLVNAADSTSPLHTQACIVRDKAATGEFRACVSFMVLNEFMLAITSRKHVKRPLGTVDALMEFDKYVNLKNITKINVHPQTYKTTSSLIKKYKLTGSGIYLAETVAVMVDNQVGVICTFHSDQYDPFSEIRVLNPFEFDERQTAIRFGE